jgi:PHD/YefM family antitoxin component YafN of YafNO toxin-antitoxin module
MGSFKEHYVVNEQGNRVAVFLEISEYRRLLTELEELESIRAFDAAKASGDEAIPFEEAVAEIEKTRSLRYTISILRRAQKELASLPQDEFEQVRETIRKLAREPSVRFLT